MTGVLCPAVREESRTGATDTFLHPGPVGAWIGMAFGRGRTK